MNSHMVIFHPVIYYKICVTLPCIPGRSRFTRKYAYNSLKEVMRHEC